MGSSLNKVMLIGRLGKDPELKETDRSSICKLTLATDEGWKDKNTGEWKEKTEWHNIVIFGKRAEWAAEWLSKGALVYVDGKITTDKWEDKDGNTRYTTKIVAFSVQPLSKMNKSDGGSNSGNTGKTASDPDDEAIPF